MARAVSVFGVDELVPRVSPDLFFGGGGSLGDGEKQILKSGSATGLLGISTGCPVRLASASALDAALLSAVSFICLLFLACCSASFCASSISIFTGMDSLLSFRRSDSDLPRLRLGLLSELSCRGCRSSAALPDAVAMREGSGSTYDEDSGA